MKNINMGLGLIALAIICSTVLIVTESMLCFFVTTVAGLGVVIFLCDDDNAS